MRAQLNNLQKWLFRPPYYGVPWAVWLYALLACACYPHGGVFAGELIGFDDNVRMVQVLDWINGAGWYDRTIMRVNAPEGFTTIWSRIVDIPIAAVIILAQLFVTQKTAAIIAALIIPFAELTILLVIVAPWFARPLVGKKYARLIVLFLMFTTVMNYRQFSVAGFHPGEASHRSWYVILNLLIFGAGARIAMGAVGTSAAMIMGIAAAISLAVGIEGFPIIAGAVAILLGIAWYFNRPRVAQRTMQAMIITAVLSFMLLPMHQPPAHLFDISFVEPSIMGSLLTGTAAIFTGLEIVILRRFGMRKIFSFMSLLCLAGLFTTALVLVFPPLLQGGAVGLTPIERTMIFNEHAEARPLYGALPGALNFVGLVMPILIALVAGIIAIRQAATPRRAAVCLACFGSAVVTGSMAGLYSRYYHHAAATACVWLLWAWQNIKNRLQPKPFYILAAFAAFIFLAPFWMLVLPALQNHEPIISGILLYPAKIQAFPDPCNTTNFSHYLDAHYDKNTLIDVPGSESAQVLYHSHLRIDFLNNYPSQNKFIDNQVFFGTQDMGVAKNIAIRHGFDLVALCMAGAKKMPLADGEEPMMYERLKNGEPPRWLKPVNTGLEGRFRLYKVDKSLLR